MHSQDSCIHVSWGLRILTICSYIYWPFECLLLRTDYPANYPCVDLEICLCLGFGVVVLVNSRLKTS